MAQLFEFLPPTLGAGLLRFRRVCGVAAMAIAVLASIIGVRHPAPFFHAYLFAALVCLNPTLGCLLLAFIHRMTGGAWGRTLAPILAAGQRMVPWTILLCVPLFFGLGHLFPWAAPGTLSAQARLFLVQHPAYFSRPAFILRSIGYGILFLVLLAIAPPGRRAWTGPVGMMLYIIATYLLAVDWVLSLEPGWSSTGFPLVFMASQALSGIAFCIAVTILAGAPVADLDKPAIWKDLGNLLLGIMMFWAYVAYSQFLVVWSGNLPHEAVWYLHRNAGGWHYVLVALAVFQLLIPLLLLLSSRTKRRTRFFAALAVGVLLCQVLYTYWLVLPSFRTQGIDFHWLDLLLPLALGGLWLFRFLGLAPLPLQEEAHA
jgi:hypothetical protein